MSPGLSTLKLCARVVLVYNSRPRFAIRCGAAHVPTYYTVKPLGAKHV
jgi:hypothetical protein